MPRFWWTDTASIKKVAALFLCLLFNQGMIMKGEITDRNESIMYHNFSRVKTIKRFLLLFLSFFIFQIGFVKAQDQDIDFVAMPDSSRNDSPVLAFLSDDTLWLAWSSFQDGYSRLAVCSRKRGQWTAIEYPGASSFNQLEPQWAMGDSQRPCLIYTEYDGIQWTVRQVERGEQGWEDPQILGQGIHPTSAIFETRKWVAWNDERKIIIQREPGLKTKSKIIELNPDDPLVVYSHPQLQAGPEGEVWLVWTASQYGYQSVLLKRIDGGNHPILVVDAGSGVNRNPQISVDIRGRVWVVYEALESIPDSNRSRSEQKEGSIYMLDKDYFVRNPSQVVVATDGIEWWKPVNPSDSAFGLTPNIHCSKNGTVWLVSRAFTGTSRPYKEFFPLFESLGPEGWENHDTLWPKKRGYKEITSLAESPNGVVWMAWVPNNRKRLGSTETPSWTFLDGTDSIAVAAVPQVESPGLPELIPMTRENIRPVEPVSFPRYQTTYNEENYQVYFGDLHQHSEFSGCGRLNGRIDQNQHYTRYIRGLDFMSTTDHAEHLNDHNWHITQITAEKNNKPGKFVTFTGFEWTSEFDAGGNLFQGHYNAIFRTVGNGDYYFSASDPRYNTPFKLWEALNISVGGKKNVLTIPHHISRRLAWVSWNFYDPEMVPLIEIVQSRGSFEYEGSFSHQIQRNDIGRVTGHYAHDGLERGMRWGFMASGDHAGRSLIAVFSPRLERDALFDSLKEHRVYATNGERMFLDVRINGHFMGEEYVLNENERDIVLKASGTTPLIQVDLFRNGRSVRQWNPNRLNIELSWIDREPLLRRESYYYVRIIQKDGGQAWSSPIWIINPNFSGKFQFQVGGDELRVIYPDQETDFSILMHNETETSVKGKVFIEVPENWKVKEHDGIEIDCLPGAWRHAVFHVTVPKSALKQLCLPEVTASISLPLGKTHESQLFVVGSPDPVSREQKAVLIDARTKVPKSQFNEYLKKMAKVWGKELR